MTKRTLSCLSSQPPSFWTSSNYPIGLTAGGCPFCPGGWKIGYHCSGIWCNFPWGVEAKSSAGDSFYCFPKMQIHSGRNHASSPMTHWSFWMDSTPATSATDQDLVRVIPYTPRFKSESYISYFASKSNFHLHRERAIFWATACGKWHRHWIDRI